jgi:hypothetical protein
MDDPNGDAEPIPDERPDPPDMPPPDGILMPPPGPKGEPEPLLVGADVGNVGGGIELDCSGSDPVCVELGVCALPPG